VHNIETTNVLLSVHDHTSTTHVTSASDHDDVARVELDKVRDFARLELELDGVVHADSGVGVTDGASVVGDDVRHTTTADGHTANFEELVGRFLGGDAVDGESTFDVVEETEVLSRFFDGDHILERKCKIRVQHDQMQESSAPWNPVG